MSTGQGGYVPTNTQEGDAICQFLGCDIAAVLRPKAGGYDIIGSALIAKSSDEQEAATKYSRSVPDFNEPFTCTPGQALNLYLDIVTLQQLTA
jgi:hypothetical protein